MPIIDALDIGRASLTIGPSTGQVGATAQIAGGSAINWSRGGKPRARSVTLNVQAPFAIGGFAAGTRGAVELNVQQLVELASNPDRNPVYIQWRSGDGVITPSPFDGFYRIDDATPLDWSYERHVSVQFMATLIALAAPSTLSFAWGGGALGSNFSGAPTNLIAYPVGATVLTGGLVSSRGGAEGPFSCSLSPLPNPVPFMPSASISNLFKGGVHVYDTVNTGTNPVPNSGSTFVNPNWVEVFDVRHNFQGDCIITNGLLLLLFRLGIGDLLDLYLWATSLALANWQHICSISSFDNSFAGATSSSYSLASLGREEASVVVISGTPNALYQTKVRLQRGRYEGRIEFRPLTQAPASEFQFGLTLDASGKIAYSPAGIHDTLETNSSVADATDYGYAGFFRADPAYPFITGFLYQNQPGAAQPFVTGAASQIAIGDSLGFPVGTTRAYGFFAIPYGVSGSYSTADLQEQESTQSLAGGFVSAADSGASAANVAKLPSGTAAGATAQSTTYHTLGAVVGDIWCRLRVTSIASGTTQIRLGLRDATSGWVAGGFTDYAPSAFATTYGWYKVAADYAPSSSHIHGYRAEGVTNAAATDFWVDEFVFVPKRLVSDNRGPQELWQQYMFDREVTAAFG
jgi:hypothetical protein